MTLGSGEALSRLVAFGVTMYLARTLGANGYGVIALAAGINLYLAKIADFGVEAAGIREIAGTPAALERLASAVLSARLLLAVGLAMVAGFISVLLLPEPESWVLAIYFLTLIPIAGSTRWIHIGLEETGPVAIARITGEACIFGLVLSFVSGQQHLIRVPLAQFAGELLAAALLIVALFLRGYRFGLHWNFAVARPVLVRGFPLLVQVTLGLLIYNSDLMFLRVFRDSTSVGYYAAAYALIAFVANLGMTFGMSLLPALTKASTDTAEQCTIWNNSLVQIMALCLPLSAGACLLAPSIITLGFGQGYDPSTTALRVLVWSIPFSTLRNVPWVALIARARGERLTSVMAWSVALNLLLNGALVPAYGFIGAGIATVTTECFCAGMMMRAAADEGLPGFPWRRCFTPVVATIVMAAAVIAIGPVTLPLAVATGIAVFLSVLGLFGGLRWRRGEFPKLNV